MTSALTQLKIAYENENMSPEEIAQDQGLDITAVKAGLMQCSSKYRKDCGKEDDGDSGLNFSNDQLKQVNEKLFNIAMSAEYPDGSPDFKTMAQVCQYIRDDKKGRKETVKQIAGVQNFNILSFNEQVATARAAVSDLKRKLIEV